MKSFELWDKTVEKILDDFEDYTKDLDEAVRKKLLTIIAKLDSKDGRLTPQNLTQVFNEIDDLFKRELKGSIKAFDPIYELPTTIALVNVDVQQKLNGIKVTEAELIREGNLSLFKEKVMSSLSSAGITDNVIIPMKQMINASVNLGHGVEALQTEFDNLFETGSASEFTTIKAKSLQSYSRQIANDATNAVNGTIQTYMKEKYDLQGIRYIGNTIKDSRPFCVHMIDKEKYPMTHKRLEVILKEYVGNKMKVQAGVLKSGKPKMVQKGAGMYPKTNTANFLTVVGGYNCRHRAFAVRLEPEAK